MALAKGGSEMEHPVRYALERMLGRLILVILVLVLLAVVVPFLWDKLSPFIIALPIAAMLQPLIGFFQRKLHVKRGFAVAFWVLLACGLACVLLYWFVSFTVEQVVNLANNADTLIKNFIGIMQTASDRVLSAAKSMPDAISDSIRASLSSALQWLGNTATGLVRSVAGGTLSVATAIPYALIYANFLILGIFFLAGSYPKLKERFHRGENRPDEANLTMLRRSAVKGTLGYLRVQLLFALMVTVISWVYFQSLGFQYAALIGLTAGILELIPLFGCGVLYIIWPIVCVLIGDYRNAWLVFGLYAAYSTLRRLIEPKIMSNSIGISPLLSLIAMFIGMRVGGIIGLIAAPVGMVVLVSAVRA
ncbi:MAG: sporulation integral membrane protein YtvI, partial [Clostridia bacterium]|nr:sporulation integral membrane protein YtvI [Clostridia bacterium]